MQNQVRTIKKVITGQKAVDGAGVKLIRNFGYHETKEFDPFLMLDAFDSTDPKDYIKGFPWHPHRGIETITYLIKGDIEHGDSLGNKGRILDGQCQWMTSGSGIIHQEMPQPSDRMLGVQIWLNMPAEHKMSPPRYCGILKEDIPVVEEQGQKVRIISGSYKGHKGAVEGEYVKPLYLDVEVHPGASWSVACDASWTLFVYIVQGSGAFGAEEQLIAEKHLVLFNEGDTFTVKASEEGVRFLLLAGAPLKEPIAWGGPIVMNTDEELQLAFREIDENTFIKR